MTQNKPVIQYSVNQDTKSTSKVTFLCEIGGVRFGCSALVEANPSEDTLKSEAQKAKAFFDEKFKEYELELVDWI